MAKAEKRELYTCKNEGDKAINFNPKMSEHHQGIFLSRPIAGSNQDLLWQLNPQSNLQVTTTPEREKERRIRLNDEKKQIKGLNLR